VRAVDRKVQDFIPEPLNLQSCQELYCFGYFLKMCFPMPRCKV